ncbi:peroxisomal carnitine O-octanoyltransferase-like [Mya arenaria]|uniref:peroxisomal carnitine O-octanoyltransferase-like n=1 Tax=Mya arenaria TaxID=6604 RepID=UPI0022E64BFF|nr:peroxisomal carnitine O-octanoyltransferase-like [Mya arenaria]
MKEMEERDVDAMFVSKDVKTFEFDQELPSLPVPSLQHTLDRYLDSVRPHVTDEEYRQTEFLAQQFASGVGKELQNQLLSRAANRKNWLERWWLDYAYLDFRLPLCPPLNFVGPGPYCTHYLSARPGSQIENAGLLVHLSLNFWHIIRQERLKPDLDSKGRHMTMDQFRRLFSTCRIPAPQRDHLNAYFKTESEGPTPFHIVVQCRGRIFVIKAVDDKEEPLTPLELQDQFQKIRDQCDNQPEGLGIGALTGENRTTWAQVRSHLMAIHPDNFRHLEMVQSSIMCVILDDTSPQDETEMCQLALAGDSSNRWFDKSLTYVVFKNGLAASNCDHTPMDAMCLVVCTYYVDLQVIKCKGKWQGTKEIRKMEAPKELVFTVDNVVHRAISNAKLTYNQIANNLQVKINHFTKYGKTFLRKLKLHPDTHVQMMLQYAYYKRHGKPAPTYQTGTTRRFYNARTETVRSCTPEAIEFAKAMMDPKLTVSPEAVTPTNYKDIWKYIFSVFVKL